MMQMNTQFDRRSRQDRCAELEIMLIQLKQEMDQIKLKLAQLSTDPLHKHEKFGDPATQPPLDSPVVWMRGQQQSTPAGYTTEILSLIHEVSADRSYPWPPTFS